MGRKAHKMKRMARNIIIAIIIVAVICGLVYSWQSRQQLDYRDCLEETAFTVDGQAVQMKWLGFYVVYEEREVEKQAQHLSCRQYSRLLESPCGWSFYPAGCQGHDHADGDP